MKNFKGLALMDESPMATIDKNRNSLIDDLFYNIKFPFTKGFINILYKDNINRIKYFIDNTNINALYIEIFLINTQRKSTTPIAIISVNSSQTNITTREHYNILEKGDIALSTEEIYNLIDTFYIAARYIYLTGMHLNTEIVFSNLSPLASCSIDVVSELACTLENTEPRGPSDVKGHWRTYKSGKKTFIKSHIRKPQQRKRKKRNEYKRY